MITRNVCADNLGKAARKLDRRAADPAAKFEAGADTTEIKPASRGCGQQIVEAFLTRIEKFAFGLRNVCCPEAISGEYRPMRLARAHLQKLLPDTQQHALQDFGRGGRLNLVWSPVQGLAVG